MTPVDEPRKLYVVVRGDLAPGLRCAQAAHAVAEMCLRYPERAWEWNGDGNYLIVLEAKDEDELRWWFWEHRAAGITCQLWMEPDLSYQWTSYAALPQPEQNIEFRRLPLAYKQNHFTRLIRRITG